MEGHIGVDESGKGDYFGPLVVAACYVGPEHVADLEGVMDSKKLTDLSALRLAALIREVCPHSIVALNPEKYNDAYEKFKNLNHLLAYGHSRAIENVLAIQPSKLAISDQFANPARLKARLKERGLDIRLHSEVRAESDLAVAAASVLARADFLLRLKELGEEMGIDLPKGAGPPVLTVGRRVFREFGMAGLRKVAKLHFKTTLKVAT